MLRGGGALPAVVEHVQTKREIQALLDGVGVRPRKRFGQHFLIDGNLMRMLVGSAELQPSDHVLEVGPGTGGLTDLLARGAREVVCVEIDHDLQEVLAARFADQPQVRLVRGDILENKHRLRGEVAAWLNSMAGGGAEEVKLVANLPYQIATPLIVNLLIDYPQVKRLCFTVQAEVGERFTAETGTHEYGPISILVRLWAQSRVVARLSPEVFWPAPTVDSIMVRLDVESDSSLSREARSAFAAFLRGVFDHRRKTLRSALGFVVDETEREQVCRTFDATRRPEAIGPKEWWDMFASIRHAEVRTENSELRTED